MTTVPILGVSLRRIALTGCPIALTERVFLPLNESPSKGSAPDGSQLKVLTEGLSDSKKIPARKGLAFPMQRVWEVTKRRASNLAMWQRAVWSIGDSASIPPGAAESDHF